MNTLKITVKELFFYLLVFTLVAESILKYINSAWVSNEYGTVISNTGKVMAEWKIAQIILVVILFFISFPIKRNIITICGVFLIGIGSIWLAKDFNDITIFYSQTTSVTLIIIGMIFIIAQNRSIYCCVEKLCPILAILYTVLCFFSAIDFMRTYSVARMADGYIIEYFSFGLFMTGIWCEFAGKSKRNTVLIYLCCFMLIYSSIIIASRGWMIQSVLLFIFCYLSFSNKRLRSRIFRILFLIVLMYIVYRIMQYFLGNQIEYLFARFSEDTRSNQLETFFEQVPFSKLLIGQGVDASYIYGKKGSYKYIDNQFLFIMFRYGILPIVLYVFPFVYSFIKTGKKNGIFYWIKRNFVLIMWLLAMGGLSIYYAIKLDILQVFLFVSTIGGIMYSDRSVLIKNNNSTEKVLENGNLQCDS